jgi:hypothetical protein
LGSTVGPKTRVILRTDAEPFRALVEGPPPAAAPQAGPAADPSPPAATSSLRFSNGPQPAPIGDSSQKQSDWQSR